MDTTGLKTGGNDLLAILPEATLDRMAPHCDRVTLARGDVVSEADQPLTTALFIESGVASIRKAGRHQKSEICIVGHESFCGMPIVLEDEAWPYRTIVQADELTGVQIEASSLRRLIAADADLRRVLLRSVQVRMVHISESLVSTARQRLNQRLASWLLMYRDRLRSDRLAVTHEFIAQMLGVQRTGVTAALHEMEGAGLISSRRGLVIILSLPALLSLAAGGYGVTEKQQARLLDARSTIAPAVREGGLDRLPEG